MKKLITLLWTLALLTKIGASHAGEYNLILLPEPYCSQAGLEKKMGEKITLGVLARFSCDSPRPTYGSNNDDVDNQFSRVLIPLRYAFSGVFTTGPIVQGMLGIENSKFTSRSDSKVEITFLDFSILDGYQWFFTNGINLAALAGIAHLQELSSDRKIAAAETTPVADFLDKNAKTNTHFGVGVVLGWAF